MKKRLFAALLALALTLGLAAPAGVLMTAEAASLTDALQGIAYYGDLSKCRLTAEQAQAYADVLNDGINGKTPLFITDDGEQSWGIPALTRDCYPLGTAWNQTIKTQKLDMSATWYTLSADHAALCDFDGNGQPYLLVYVDIADGNEGSGMVLFGLQGNQVNRLIGVAAYFVGAAGWGHYRIAQSSDGKYWVSYETTGEMKFWDYISVSNGALGKKYSFEDHWDGSHHYTSESDPNLSSAQIEQMVNSYTELDIGSSNYHYSTLRTTADGLSAYAANLLIQNATPDEILAQIPYYGDRSKCKLTSEMADQMVQALENWVGTDLEYEYDRSKFLCAYLVDGDGSGIPALVIVSEMHNKRTLDLALDWLDLYTWETDQLSCSMSLSTDYQMPVWDNYRCYFGKWSNGLYEWSSQWHFDIYDESTSYTIQNGYLVKDNNKTTANDTYDAIDYKIGGGKNEMISLLRAYADAKKYPTYSYTQAESGDKYYSDVTAAVSGQGTVQAIYKLLEDAYYVLLENQGAYTGAVVRGLVENGRPVWKVTQTDPEPAGEDVLAQLVSRLAGSSNLSLDFGKLQGSPALDELTAYLRELLKNIDGLAPNDPAKNDLAAFVDGAAAALASGSVNGKDNRLTLGEKAVADLVKRAREASSGLSGELREAGVELNKSLTPRVRVLWGNLDGEKACQLTFDQKLAQALDGCDLQVLLGDGRTYLQISAGDLRALTDELGGLSVQFQKEEGGSYAIRFLDGGGQVVEQLSRPVTVGLPAPGELATIMASYAGGSDNWGGQYDPAAGAITFETAFSGSYEVLENNVAIDDIGELSEESREAISFMVSRGYMSAEEGQFRPADSLTRYEFTEALVGMFFALDRSLTTTFPDVPADSPYYAHVASAQARSIVNGYDDGTFGGEDVINREQVFALAARTLMDYKGYVAPADAEGYLSSFEDRDQLSGWAAQQVALSVREGVAARGSRLSPQAGITREQAAVTLYRLFRLLYEVPPVALDVPEASSEGLPVPVIVGGCAAVAAAAAGGAVVLLRKKPKTGAEV